MQRTSTRFSRYLAGGIAVAATAGVIAYGCAQSYASSYRATAILSLMPETGGTVPASDLRGAIYESQREAALGLHISGLRAQSANPLLAEALGLGDAGSTAHHLEVAERGDEQVAVTVAAPDPDRAVHAVNAVVDGYQASLVSATRDERQALAQHKRRQEVAAAEAALARAEAQLKAAATPSPATNQPLDDELSRLTSEVAQAERERQQIETRARDVRTAIAEGRAEQYVSAQQSPLTLQLTQVKAHISDQIARMSKTLPPDHPRLQELSSDLSGVDRQLAVQAVKIAESLEDAVPALQSTEQRLRSSLKSLQSQNARRGNNEAARRDAERAVAAQRDALTALRTAPLPAVPPDIAAVAVERATAAVRVPNAHAQRFSVIAGFAAFAVVAAAALLVALTRSRS